VGGKIFERKRTGLDRTLLFLLQKAITWPKKGTGGKGDEKKGKVFAVRCRRRWREKRGLKGKNKGMLMH